MQHRAAHAAPSLDVMTPGARPSSGDATVSTPGVVIGAYVPAGEIVTRPCALQ
jgi:hypothetical protein